jgi:hypothetical protein
MGRVFSEDKYLLNLTIRRLIMELVDLKSSQLKWVPVSETETLYVGQLVQSAIDTGGAEPLGAASGNYDITSDKVIVGLVVATSNTGDGVVQEDGNTVTGFNGLKITGVVSQANLNARQNLGVKGPYSKGSKVAYVLIALLDSTTRIRARLFNASYGTTPALLTVTAGSTDGGIADTYVTNAADVASVPNFSTIYCRTGNNAGEYRVVSTTSTTTHQNDVGFHNNVLASPADTFVMVNAKDLWARVQFDSDSLFIDTSAAITADYYGVFIDVLDLKTAGQEICEFRFSPRHFSGAIA